MLLCWTKELPQQCDLHPHDGLEEDETQSPTTQDLKQDKEQTDVGFFILKDYILSTTLRNC